MYIILIFDFEFGLYGAISFVGVGENGGKEGKCYLSARRIVPTLVSWLLKK